MTRLAGLSWPSSLRRMQPHLRAVNSVEGMISLDEADLLFRLAVQADGSGCIIEIGSFRGRSTVALAHGASSSPVFAIEPHEPFTGELGGKFGPQDRGAFFRTMLRSRGYERVRLVNLSSEIVAPGWSQPIGLLWIDGDHSNDGVRADWDVWKPHLVSRALVAFDDSTDETLGPHGLIRELVDDGELTPIEQVGKVTALQRR